MPGWLKSAYNWAVNSIGDVWNDTLGLFGAIYTYFSDVVANILGEIGDIYNGLTSFIESVEKWAQSSISQLITWVKSIYNTLTTYFVSLFNDAINYVNQLYKWAAGYMAQLYSDIRNGIASVVSWAIKNIYDPVAGAIQTLANWITRYGYVAYTLATHPEMLSRLLAKYIWQESLSLADHYAAPVATWLLRGMVKMADPVGKVIEDIIASIIE